MAKHHAEEFFSIDVESLRPNEPITFEVYLYLPLNEHVIKLLNISEKTEKTFIERFIKRGIRQLHVRNRDHANYMQYVASKPNPSATMEATTASPQKPEEPTPIPFTPSIEPEVVMKGLLSNNPDEAAKAKEEAKKVIEEIMESPPESETPKMIMNIELDHANGVAIYSVLFAMGIGIKDKVLLQDYVTASMIHDIGLSQIPPSAACIPMTVQQGSALATYQSHAEWALAVIDELSFTISPRARQILEQHHEKFNGTGYPKKLEGFHIIDNAQVLGMAELLDSMIRGFFDGTKRTLDEAIAMICKIEKQSTFPCYFNPDLFKKVMLWIRKGSGLDYIAQAESVVKETQEQIINKAA